MGVTAGKYHLFKRSRKSGDFYYCWFWQGNERIIKTCGRACTGKREGVAFLEDLLKQEITGTKRTIALQSTTIKGFAKDMFTEGVPHLARWAAKGKVLKRQTIIQPRRHLTACLLPKFGKLRFTEITPTASRGLPSGTAVFQLVPKHHTLYPQTGHAGGQKSRYHRNAPGVEPFKRHGKRQNILSSGEFTRLFPYDEDELIRIWTRPDDK